MFEKTRSFDAPGLAGRIAVSTHRASEGEEVASALQLLPDDWNGKFVMGGGGGFVGSVVVRAADGYHGGNRGHQGHPLEPTTERSSASGTRRWTVTSQALIAGYYG